MNAIDLQYMLDELRENNLLEDTSTPIEDENFYTLVDSVNYGDLVTIAGRPSVGKSLVLINFLENQVKEKDEIVLFISLRDSAMDNFRRLRKYLGRYLKNVLINPHQILTPNQLITFIKVTLEAHNLKGIYIDDLDSVLPANSELNPNPLDNIDNNGMNSLLFYLNELKSNLQVKIFITDELLTDKVTESPDSLPNITDIKTPFLESISSKVFLLQTPFTNCLYKKRAQEHLLELIIGRNNSHYRKKVYKLLIDIDGEISHDLNEDVLFEYDKTP